MGTAIARRILHINDHDALNANIEPKGSTVNSVRLASLATQEMAVFVKANIHFKRDPY